MNDRHGEQILATIERFAERAALLGAVVRRLAAPGTDALGVHLARLTPPENGCEVRALGDGWEVAVVTPSRREDLAFAAAVLTGDPATRDDQAGVHAMPRPEAARVLASLAQTALDLIDAGDSGAAMQEYCGYLTRSYENMAMVYRLVRSLGRLGSPDDIVQQSLRNMVETLECEWAAVCFEQAPALVGELATRTFTAVHDGDDERVRPAVAEFLATLGPVERRIITPEANGGVSVIVQPIRVRNADVGRLIMAGKLSGEADVSSFDTQLMEAVSACIGSLLETIRLYEEQAATFMGTLRALSSSLDAKDRYTRGHSERVALLARDLAIEIGLSADEAERVHLAGILHDIGKIGVPDRVLCKPGKLTDEEFGLIKRHPRIGHEILKPIPMVRDLLPGVLHHHERWDGRGYPENLRAQDIPLVARILAIADTFDAMSSNRAYRPARSREEVLAEIERSAGTQLDPDLVPTFLRMSLDGFDALIRRHSAEQVNEQPAEGRAEAA